MLGSRSAYTRARILAAAERLFAYKGPEATSLREITAEARVNLSSVHYHFGSKEGLIQAVYQQLLDVLNRERLALLDKFESQAQGAALDAAQIVEAYFGPLIQHAAGDTTLGKLVFTNPSPVPDATCLMLAFIPKDDAHTCERFRSALVKALPMLAPYEIMWRFRFMLMAASCALHHLEALHRASENGPLAPPDIDRTTRRVLEFLIAGLLAPQSGEQSSASHLPTCDAGSDLAAQ